MSTLTSMMPAVNERDNGIDSGSDNSGSYSDSYYSEQQNENKEEEFEIRTTSAMRISSTNEHGSNSNAFNTPTDDNTASLLDRIVVVSSSLLFTNKSQSKPYPHPQQQVKLQQQLQLQKQHNKSLSTLAPSSAITDTTRTTTSAAAASAASILLSLRMIPKDVLSNEILDFLSDKSIKRFLSCLGERRVKSDLYKLDQRFCFKHGSKLEDSNQFHIIVNKNTQRTMVDDEDDDDEKDENPSSSSSPSPPSTTVTPTMKQAQLPQQSSSLCLRCPECYAEEQHTKRCHSCRKFYPKFFLNSNSNNNTNTNQTTTTTTTTTSINSSTAGPGLWCQQCDRMAFCNACLSNDTDGCGSSTRINDGEDIDDDDDDDNNNNTTPVITSRKHLITTSIAPFGAFGRHKRLRNYCSRSNTTKGRITCHNCCCPNVFTNTMCGEFICGDCGEQHIRKSTTITKGDGDGDGDGDNNDTTTNPIGAVEVCDECGKATCLDPNCLVCTDFRLINICCSFNPEDAYKFNFFGYGNNNNNNGLCGGRADSFTKLRHYIVDSTIYIGFIVILYNMWWHHLNQEQEQQQQQQDFVPGGL